MVGVKTANHARQQDMMVLVTMAKDVQLTEVLFSKHEGTGWTVKVTQFRYFYSIRN